jgi:hypothetical protein
MSFAVLFGTGIFRGKTAGDYRRQAVKEFRLEAVAL